MDGKGSLLSQEASKSETWGTHVLADLSLADAGPSTSLRMAGLFCGVAISRLPRSAGSAGAAFAWRGRGGDAVDGEWQGSEGDEGAEDEEDKARPDPADEGIQKCLDDGLAGVGVGAFIDDVRDPNREASGWRPWSAAVAGDIDAFLGCHLELFFAVPVDIENGVFGVVVGGSSPG